MKKQISEFITYLKSNNFSKSSIVNYKTDLNQFSAWMDENKLRNPREDFEKYIKVLKNNFKESSVNRKASSINNFLDYSYPKKDETAIKPSKNIMYQRNALLLGAYSISLVALMIIFSQQLNYKDNFLANPEVSNVGIIQDEYSEIKEADGLVIAVSAPNKINHTDQAAFYLEEENISDYENNLPNFGKSTIKSGDTSTIIYNENIGNDSIFLVTPTTPTHGNTIYIESLGDGYAQISIEKTVNFDLHFNWMFKDVDNYINIF